jgi:hypothetical protein
MALIKMAAAARKAGAGSANTIRRALQAAGVPLIAESPGNFLVDEEDLVRFLAENPDWKSARPSAPDSAPASGKPGKPGKPKTKKPDKRRR